MNSSAKRRIPFSKPTLGDREVYATEAALRSGWTTQGPKVAEFEAIFCAYCGTTGATALSSCTAALHLALLTFGVRAGDEVICPSMSFIATANAIDHTGARVVFADVDPKTYNLAPESVRSAITRQTKVILVVHQLGVPADVDSLRKIADEYNIALIEDAACALGSRYKGRLIGGHTEMACFSFHPRKIACIGEGGMITSNNPLYIDNLKLLRQHGMNISAERRHEARQIVFEQYVCRGYNYRMTDIQAAIGIEQLKQVDTFIDRRRQLAKRYNDGLQYHPFLQPPYIPTYAEPNYQTYAVHWDSNAPIERDEFMQLLLDRGISTRVSVMLSHCQPAYEHQARTVSLANSEFAHSHSLALPIYSHMMEDEVDYVLEMIDEITRRY